jgi:PAS domain S-box-containing protein
VGYGLVGEAREESVAFILDLTKSKQAEEDLRQSEEKFRQLAENISEAVFWMSDLKNRQTLYVSPSYEEIWGRECASVYANNSQWLEATHPEDRQRAEAAYQKQIDGDRYEIEYRIIRPDGSLRWIRDRGFGIKDVAGNPDRMVGIAEDITKRKQAEEEREELLAREQAARAEAETANRIKDEFLAVLSHELRSPLNPILGWTQMLQTYNFEEERKAQGLATIERNAKLLLELIDDLLDIARILRGKMTLKCHTSRSRFCDSSSARHCKYRRQCQIDRDRNQISIDRASNGRFRTLAANYLEFTCQRG